MTTANLRRHIFLVTTLVALTAMSATHLSAQQLSPSPIVTEMEPIVTPRTSEVPASFEHPEPDDSDPLTTEQRELDRLPDVEMITPLDQPVVVFLTVLRHFPKPPPLPYKDAPGYVFRRITSNCLEFWTSTTGWLVSPAGKVLHEAKITRKGGSGREWFGAFLPDGSYVTTEIWEFDRSLHLFSASGKWVATKHVRELAPPEVQKSFNNDLVLIGWARSDKSGQGWVFEIFGEYQGTGPYYTRKDLNARLLKDDEPWTLTMPRELGPRNGMVPSDDGKRWILREQQWHGRYVAYPSFTVTAKRPSLVPAGPQGFSVTLHHGGDNFGFWPNSHAYFLPTGLESRSNDITWFWNAENKCLGSIEGERISDAADRESLLMLLGNGVATISPELRVSEVREFALPDDSHPKPLALYEELNVGFFDTGNEILMAKWKQ